jgi:hypothetical protein
MTSEQEATHGTSDAPVWQVVDNQVQLDLLNRQVCWDDAALLEFTSTRAPLRCLPHDVCRSGHDHPNLYVLFQAFGPGGEYLELAFIHCDRYGAAALEHMRLNGHVDSLKRVELRSSDGDTLLRCARLAFRALDDADESGLHFARMLLEAHGP